VPQESSSPEVPLLLADVSKLSFAVRDFGFWPQCFLHTWTTKSRTYCSETAVATRLVSVITTSGVVVLLLSDKWSDWFQGLAHYK
jgi:hypothetical protein